MPYSRTYLFLQGGTRVEYDTRKFGIRREKSVLENELPYPSYPNSLPNHYNTALATLRNTARILSKDYKWAETYEEQMKDMVDRRVARKLTPQEPGILNFPPCCSHHGVSLNSCLAKGPDAYINNLIGILLRWREEHVAFVGDLKKMFNSIHLMLLEQHCHRFLWRGMDTEREPDIYVMERVNMGDSPAPAISMEVIYKTTILFEDESPEAAELLRKSTYCTLMI